MKANTLFEKIKGQEPLKRVVCSQFDFVREKQDG